MRTTPFITALALLAPSLSGAEISEGVLQYTWGASPPEEEGTPDRGWLQLDGKRISTNCRRADAPSDSALAESVRQVQLCYHDGGLFQVELFLDANRVDLFEEALRDKYGNPGLEATTRRSRGRHAEHASRSRQDGEDGEKNASSETARRERRQHLTEIRIWETDAVRIALDGRLLRYQHKPALEAIRAEMAQEDEALKEAIRAAL